MAAPPYFTPAVEPPAGVIPNPNHPESLAVWNTVCAVTCLSVATTVFAARAYVRLHLKKQWILEDWIAPIFSLVGVVVRFQVSASPDQTWFQPIMLLWA
ncbi:uncharacterized protein KY384_002552 [Bacidia gigantensis]|uniref:uncharacterized protein n=1 Tax=Bacidia gigantensis TaxID=2732470 RepID=UPI001D03AAD2|nr:uncharacterized protein KY384_002552 [Bacidia gigantensis]KAG8532675.1 hypothetical protein KY384_002552 [Bacidia gigantensis]